MSDQQFKLIKELTLDNPNFLTQNDNGGFHTSPEYELMTKLGKAPDYKQMYAEILEQYGVTNYVKAQLKRAGLPYYNHRSGV